MRRAIMGMLAAMGLLLALVLGPGVARAQQGTVSINAYLCPADYDRILDCSRLQGVVVSVKQDGQEIGPLTTLLAEPVQVGVLAGAAIQLAVTGGQPAGTTLESTQLSFDAVEGENPVTLVFVEEDDTPAGGMATLTIRAFTCPAGYEGDDYAGECDAPRAGADLRYLVSAPDAEFIDFETDAGGSVVVNVPSPTLGGGVTVALPSGIAGYAVACATIEGTGEVGTRYTAVGFALSGMESGDDIACDLYYVPAAGAGDDDDEDDDDGGPVIGLPNTGAVPANGTGMDGALLVLLGASVACGLAALGHLRRA